MGFYVNTIMEAQFSWEYDLKAIMLRQSLQASSLNEIWESKHEMTENSVTNHTNAIKSQEFVDKQLMLVPQGFYIFFKRFSLNKY